MKGHGLGGDSTAQRSNQTAFIEQFGKAGDVIVTGILTVSLSTTPQQLFSVILCSQNATLHAEPGNRGRRYIVFDRRQIRSSLKACQRRYGFHWFIERKDGHHFLWRQTLQWSPSTLTGRSDQYQCWYSRWKVNQSASRTSTSADKPVFFIWAFCRRSKTNSGWLPSQPAGSAWIKVRCDDASRLSTGSSGMFSTTQRWKRGGQRSCGTRIPLCSERLSYGHM